MTWPRTAQFEVISSSSRPRHRASSRPSKMPQALPAPTSWPQSPRGTQAWAATPPPPPIPSAPCRSSLRRAGKASAEQSSAASRWAEPRSRAERAGHRFRDARGHAVCDRPISRSAVDDSSIPAKNLQKGACAAARARGVMARGPRACSQSCNVRPGPYLQVMFIYGTCNPQNTILIRYIVLIRDS